MKNISEHISYKEGTYSVTALRLGLNNDPTKTHLSNMELLAEKIFEPLRKHVGGPIKINSFYRGPELNKAIGGSSKSQHCEGRAIDLDDTYGHMSNADMYEYIKNNLNLFTKYGQRPKSIRLATDAGIRSRGSPDAGRQ